MNNYKKVMNMLQVIDSNGFLGTFATKIGLGFTSLEVGLIGIFVREERFKDLSTMLVNTGYTPERIIEAAKSDDELSYILSQVA
jgi:hypothetical protein